MAFDNHTGCDFILSENNKKSYAYCIQRGYPISKQVDELWKLMVKDSCTENEYHLGQFNTIAEKAGYTYQYNTKYINQYCTIIFLSNKIAY